MRRRAQHAHTVGQGGVTVIGFLFGFTARQATVLVSISPVAITVMLTASLVVYNTGVMRELLVATRRES